MIPAASLSTLTPRLPLRDARLELEELADKLPGVQDPLVKDVALDCMNAGLPAYLIRVSPDNQAQRRRAISLANLAMLSPGGLARVVDELGVRADELQLIAPVNTAAREAIDDALRHLSDQTDGAC